MSLSTELDFCSAYARTIQVAFETNVILDVPTIRILIQGLATAITGATIDSVTWAIRPVAQKQIPLSSTICPIASDPFFSNTVWHQLLIDQHSRFHFTSHPPQRAILAQPSAILFLHHAGPSSANEALVAGESMPRMSVYSDQLPNSMRLHKAGVTLSLNKNNFTAEVKSAKIGQLIQDREGHF